MHRLSKVVGVKLLAAAVALGAAGWAMTDGEAVAQTKSQHHPRLHRALHELRQAHHNLKGAQGTFGGHRSEALRDVDRAIHQVERALRYSRPNGTTNVPGVSVTGTPIRTGGSVPSSITTGVRTTRGSQRGVLIIPRR
jgi:hypothetical protein